MTAKPMTRREALKIVQECIQNEMRREYPKTIMAQRTGEHDRISSVSEARYAELAAALAYIENMARQKELHL